MSLRATTSQTIGPYLRIGLEWMVIEDLAPQGVPGERVRIEGRIVDADGKPVNDAAVEIWQANSRQVRESGGRAVKPLDSVFAGMADRSPTMPAISASAPSSRVACRDRKAAHRRRMSR